MKHLRVYENYDELFKYEPGDFVWLYNDDNNPWNVYLCVEVIDGAPEGNSDVSYKVKAWHKNKKQYDEFWIDSDDISRKATEEEIEKFNMFGDIKKFNL